MRPQPIACEPRAPTTISDMKNEAAFAALTVTAIAISLNPHMVAGTDELAASEPKLSEARHQDHIEIEAVDPGVLAKAEREVRPIASLPFRNEHIFARPVEHRWQPESFVWGTPLPLLAESQPN